MLYLRQFFQRKTLKLLALVLVTMLLGACSISNSRGCVANSCYQGPEGWRLAYTELDDDNNGIINSITRYEYSPEGAVSTVLDEDLDAHSKEKRGYRYDYDRKGRLLRINADFELDGEFITTMSYHYDWHGNLSKIRTYCCGFDTNQTLTYDDSCRLQELSFDKFKIQYSYDDIGRMIRESVFTFRQTEDNAGLPSDGSAQALQLMSDNSYGYDESGNIILMEGPFMGTYQVSQFEYDEMGRLSEKRFVVTRGRKPGGEYFFGDTTYYYWEEIGDTSAQMRSTHPCP